MNPDLLRIESPHVRAEWEKLRKLNRAQESALLVAAQVAQGRFALEDGVPAVGEDENVWLDFFLKAKPLPVEVGGTDG